MPSLPMICPGGQDIGRQVGSAGSHITGGQMASLMLASRCSSAGEGSLSPDDVSAREFLSLRGDSAAPLASEAEASCVAGVYFWKSFRAALVSGLHSPSRSPE